MKFFDTIYRVKKSPPKPSSKNPAKHWPFFYKSLQIVLSVWIVTVLAIISQPWLDYWVKSRIKPTDYRLQTTANIQGTSDSAVDGSQSSVSEGQFHLHNGKVDIEAPIIEGTQKENLEQGIGHHTDTPWPNEKGNVILAGSNFELDPDNPYGKIFISLRLVDVGDEVTIDYQDKTYTYQVFKKETVKPDDTTLFGQTDEWLLTFYTCDPPYTDWKRLVLQARLTKIE